VAASLQLAVFHSFGKFQTCRHDMLRKWRKESAVISPTTASALADTEMFPTSVSLCKDAPVPGPAQTGCALRAFGVASAPADRIDGMRQKPGPPLSQRISPVLLKYSDEQTVIGLAAVLDAANRFGLQDTDFTDWGVIAAPCRLGRPKLAGTLIRFDRDGVRGISPMIVPHLSLHALSGTISQALHSHGLNFGVSSGSDHLAEGLSAAIAILSDGRLPALWLVLTCWDSVPIPDEEACCPPRDGKSPVCQAVALALTRSEKDSTGSSLRLVSQPPALSCSDGLSATVAADLSGLTGFLLGRAGRSWTCPLAAGGWVELTGPLPPSPTETQS
jgi:hypothetical protein